MLVERLTKSKFGDHKSVVFAFALLFLYACSPSDSDRGISEVDGATTNGPLNGFLEELDALVPPTLDANNVPGAVIGIIHDGRVWATAGFGYADGANQIPVTDNHVFNVGSLSKTVASWGALRLVEEGQLDLDTPVSDYLSRWQLPESAFDHDGVTLRRLLSHTAGLSLPGYPGFLPSQQLPSVEESLSGATNGAGAVEVAFEPGSEWRYSGGGYTLAQLLTEEASGLRFSEFMDAEVLRPLGMVASSFIWNGSIDSIAATPHGDDGQAIMGRRFAAMAAAGLQTTLVDMMQFALASMGRLGGPGGTQGVLRQETIALMQTPIASVPSEARTASLDPDILRQAGSVSYGLGYQLSKVGSVEFASHGGVNEGWVALMYVAPELGDGIVIMTNGSRGIEVCLAIACRWITRVAGVQCNTGM